MHHLRSVIALHCCITSAQYLSSWQRSSAPLFLSSPCLLDNRSAHTRDPCQYLVLKTHCYLSPWQCNPNLFNLKSFHIFNDKMQAKAGSMSYTMTHLRLSHIHCSLLCEIQTSALSHYTIHPVTSAKLSFTTEICTVFWYTALLYGCASITFICLCAQHHSIW